MHKTKRDCYEIEGQNVMFETNEDVKIAVSEPLEVFFKQIGIYDLGESVFPNTNIRQKRHQS